MDVAFVHRRAYVLVTLVSPDRPTSLEFIRDTAYVVTLTGEIWTIDHR